MVQELDNNQDPLTLMNVLRAIEWGVGAWDLDIKIDTIVNCF